MEHKKASDAVREENFVTLLRRQRLARGLSQTALAKKLNVVPSTVSLWESGESCPKAETIPKLARLLGVDSLELTRLIEPEMSSSASK